MLATRPTHGVRSEDGIYESERKNEVPKESATRDRER